MDPQTFAMILVAVSAFTGLLKAITPFLAEVRKWLR
jgi:hypothetical protein